MIINLYIEIKRKNLMSEFERFVELERYLKDNALAFYNATDFDSCTSGSCSLNTLEEIQEAIEGVENATDNRRIKNSLPEFR